MIIKQKKSFSDNSCELSIMLVGIPWLVGMDMNSTANDWPKWGQRVVSHPDALTVGYVS